MAPSPLRRNIIAGKNARMGENSGILFLIESERAVIKPIRIIPVVLYAFFTKVLRPQHGPTTCAPRPNDSRAPCNSYQA